MSYPLLYFVDAQGITLPEEDGYQHYRQYGGAWYVEIEGEWNGGVGLLGETEIFPLTKISSNQWAIPDNHPVKKEIATRAGYITAVLLDASFQRISDAPQTQLWIEPASLSESDLDKIIAEIGLLALSVGSLVSHRASTYIGEQTGGDIGKSILPGGQLLPTAQALLELYRSVRNVWTEIEKRPLRSFRQEIVPIDITKKVNSAQAIISRTLNPNKKKIIATGSIESIDCAENQFLCYVLDVYLHDIASSLITGIENNSESNSLDNFSFNGNRTDNSKISSFLAKAEERYERRKHRLSAGRDKKLQLLADLRQCVQWSQNFRHNSFLRDVDTPHTPNLNSQRLIKSPTYGLVLEAYNKYHGGYSADLTQIIRLYRATISLGVKKTWELYEIWCFVKLYSALVTQLRLRTPSNDLNLFESIELKNREISIPKNQEFRLEGISIDKTPINISLWYEPEENNLRPDFKLKITVGLQENLYYFDAKYRNYQSQKVDRLISDVIDTAKDKYLDRLGAKASFIFHSDRRFDFWGEVPLKTFINQRFEGQSSIITTGYINHIYGAIAITPGVFADRQINRLIKLIFQYHDRFCLTCLNCGCEAETQTSWIPDRWSEQQLRENIINRVRGSWGGAIYCSCQQCGDFWIVQRCYGNHHRLLKFSNSFHQRSPRYPKHWIYLCPECGSDLYQEGQSNRQPEILDDRNIDIFLQPLD